MTQEHGFERGELQTLFSRARVSQKILQAISRPAEAKPWYKYRPIFLTNDRIHAGVKFWRQHAAALADAQRTYGVAPEVIVAIIGVETFYGRNAGRFKVLDALTTLAFYYPKRADFFRGELEHFLLLAREQRVDPLSLTGSYAGAMGLPQFISSSYRSYAVDFDNDGRIDIWNNPVDAIGSVANYLKMHGWQAGKTVAVRARVYGEAYRKLVRKDLEPKTSLDRFERFGVVPVVKLEGRPHATLVGLDTAAGTEYWLGLRNFYVITRYNHSPLYAMAVYQLAEAIREQYKGDKV